MKIFFFFVICQERNKESQKYQKRCWFIVERLLFNQSGWGFILDVTNYNYVVVANTFFMALTIPRYKGFKMGPTNKTYNFYFKSDFDSSKWDQRTRHIIFISSLTLIVMSPSTLVERHIVFVLSVCPSHSLSAQLL